MGAFKEGRCMSLVRSRWASSAASRKHEVTFSGFGFVGVWFREHLEFESGRSARITSHELTVLA